MKSIVCYFGVFAFFCFFLYTVPAYSVSILSNISFDTYYNSNILQLSEENIDEFTRGEKPEKYHINSVDDIVTETRGEFGIKHTYLKGHTQIDRLFLKYGKFWNNEIKNYIYLGAELKQYFSKYLYVSLKYFYYPEIYTNHYKSALDDSYHEFSCEKDIYRFLINWTPYNWLQLKYALDYEKHFYNEYFPEYNATNYDHEIGVTLLSKANHKAEFCYTYTISAADGEEVFNPENMPPIIRDASYESNIYYVELSTPLYLDNSPRKCVISCSTEFEERFFQSQKPASIDPFHSGRKDKILTINLSANYSLSENINIKAYYEYKLRDTLSPLGYVEIEKEYDLHKAGASIGIKIR
jgi:hypothetical protein